MTRCLMCGRILKNPESIARGIGSECYNNPNKMKPLRGWEKRLENTATIKNGGFISVGEYFFGGSNMSELQKAWLIKNKFILKDGDVSDKLLNEVFKNITVDKGDFNGEGQGNT